MLRNRRTLIYILTTILILLSSSVAAFAEVNAQGNIVEERYSTILKRWAESNLNNVDGVNIKITPSHFTTNGGNIISDKLKNHNYYGQALYLKSGNTFEFRATVPESGLYNISLDYFTLDDEIMPGELSVQINNKFQYQESKNIVLPDFWESASTNFQRDRYDNEVIGEQVKLKNWQNYIFEDPSQLQPEALKFEFAKGENTVKITINNGELLIGDAQIASEQKYISYLEYTKNHSNVVENNNVFIKLEAEKPSYKNDTSLIPVVSRDLEVYPYDTDRLLLNTIGGSSWSKGGQAVYYKIEVPQDGLYKIAIKYNLTGDAFKNKASELSTHENTAVYRTIMIDNKVPFSEVKDYAFKYTSKWKTEILGTKGTPYEFYLSKGSHTIALKVDDGIFCDTINSIMDALNNINTLALQVKKLVGGESDKYIDWSMSDYFPNIKQQLEDIKESLKKEYDRAVKLNDGDKNAKGITSLDTVMKQIDILEKNPDKIPQKLTMLNDGDGSITKGLVSALSEFENQPLLMDELYVYNGNQKLPSIHVPFFKGIWEGIKRFVHSFAPKKAVYASGTQNGIVLNVWVNRARNYVELMQKIADDDFTAKTGIKINFSIMPDEQKLILANASGTSPDIALGISNYLPYDIGIRGALLDLRSFKDFPSVIKQFSPGALVPMVSDGKCYGLPETQDAYVLFYRKDIFDALKIPIPNTWQDVINILPELQRYGMNFYSPIGGALGLKAFLTTSPFIYQNGGKLYNPDGMTTAIDSKESLQGIKLMTDLFTIYGMPMQIPNFYEHFKDGSIPIGISNFATYIQLNIAAPELKGSWAILPSPGIKDKNGMIERWQTGSAQSTIIFKNTKYPKESWEFLKWWLSTKVQAEFGDQLQTVYGDEYMWNTANVDAFSQLPIPVEDKKVVLEQWKWLREVEKTPASYVVERELSNTWSSVVLQGKNLRASVDEAVIKINKELNRKMTEFGYIKNGKMIRPYRIPTIEEIKGWVK